ncbi:MAG: hypothetical protein A2V70_05605 [Planctomycetes bacterium RBG_13_63_9]|nr:MAG: hypothetical protein A2V70_05605 [Planctomycetes bacterium RBG_13_63_9]
MVLCDGRRSAMAGAMLGEEALVGGGTSGRLWHRRGRFGLPDGLMTLTLLLVILSQSDRPLSRVLDEMASPK